MGAGPVKVTCSTCTNAVELQTEAGQRYLRQHRKTRGGKWCDGGGRHESFNGKLAEPSNPGDMHEPKPYTGELDWPPTDAIPFT